ncbi:MAG: beta-propeller fold lactonase family protein [Caldithrix sp.]|nr:beta-propeller fold lactonase family protein [Caldithrix sp.]
MYRFIIQFSRFSLFALIFALVACNQNSEPLSSEKTDRSFDNKMDARSRVSLVEHAHHMVIANRNSGSITVIDTRTERIRGTYDLPTGAQTPQPMYVVWVPHTNRVFVGDRSNDRVVVFNADNYSVETTVEAGKGIFHMWAGKRGKQLWVNNDIDNTATIIDPRTLEVLHTVPMPADLVAAGGKPHDVILEPKGDKAFVTMLGFAGEHDYVVRFNTNTYQETGRRAVGKDPHLSLHPRNDLLYIPNQNTNELIILNRSTMQEVKNLAIPGAHGAGMDYKGQVFLTTNLPGGGENGIYAVRLQNNEIIGSVDTPYPIPHNLAFNAAGDKVYLTHSGGSSQKVTVYELNRRTQELNFHKEFNVGLNPFGLALAK